MFTDTIYALCAGLQEAPGLHCDTGPSDVYNWRLLAHDLGAEDGYHHDDHQVDRTRTGESEVPAAHCSCHNECTYPNTCTMFILTDPKT